MKRRCLAAALLATVASAGPAASAPQLERLHATRGQEPAIVDRGGREVLLRGVNVNQLGDYYQANPKYPPTIPLREEELDRIAAFGFDHVRLLVHWSVLEPRRGVFDSAYLARVRQAVRWAKQRGLYVVLDMHQDAWGKHIATPPGEQCTPPLRPNVGWDGAPEWATLTDGLSTCRLELREASPAAAQAWQSFYADREGIQGELVRTWARLAREFAPEPAVAGYDLLNEPNPGFTLGVDGPVGLSLYYARAIAAIRAAERAAPGGFSHIVFFEPPGLWSSAAVYTIPPPSFTSDPNLVFAPHIYAGSITADGAVTGRDFVTPRDGHDAAAAAARTYGVTYWSGEWGWFGDPARDRAEIAEYARVEDERLVGGAWWQWKQACGDPHNISAPGGEPGSSSGNINRFACPSGRKLGTPAGTRQILARAYPRAAPGRLTTLQSDPESGRLRVAGRDGDAGGSCELLVWLPGERGAPLLAGRNVSGIRAARFAGGFLAMGCARGSYELRTTGFAPGARSCLSRRAPIGPRGVGRVRLGDTPARAARRTGIAPAATTPHSLRWCVKGSRARVVAVYAGRARRARLIATTAPGHRLRGVGAGTTERALLRRFPRARRLGRGLRRAGPRSRRRFRVRSGRVRSAVVSDLRLIRDRATIRRFLRRGSLR